MRNSSRRSFTVEVKSVGRRSSTFIPTRVSTPPELASQTVFSTPVVNREPMTEKRRVLPNLIEPEVPAIEPAALPVAEDVPPRRPRGRPRKVLPAATAPVAAEAERAIVVEPVIVTAPVPAPVADPEAPETERSAPLLRKRKDIPAAELPRGERWKLRRLGRWSR